MPRANANGIEIEYETFGDSSAEPLLLIMGLGSQMILWHDDFCRQLAGRGHYAIRFDNRDVGLSTKLDAAGLPNIMSLISLAQQGEKSEAPYTLDDMADDCAGLLDALGIERAHICGASMGGMIAQTVAIRHPSRVKSLVSIMSMTGSPEMPLPRAEVLAFLLNPPPSDRAGYIEHSVVLWRTIGSPGFPFDEAMIRERSGRVFDRCFYPQGQVRQLAAVLAHGSRREALRHVEAPTLVIHGADDPLISVEGGRDTAALIPGAELMIVEGMGHDQPRQVWPRAIDAITKLTQRAAGAARRTAPAQPDARRVPAE